MVLLFAALALSAPKSPPVQRNVFTRPDIYGDLVVFTCEGDLFLGDVKTGQARRITTDPGLENNARFSPDGTQIAFSAQYDGGRDIYVMPVGGGAPKRLTYESGGDVQDWTPDGKSVLYRSAKSAPVRGIRRLWTVPAAGGMPQLLPVPEGSFASYQADGTLVYVPSSFEWANWYRYKAGGADDVWSTDLKGHFQKLTTYEGVDTTPVVCAGAIFYVSEASGVSNLWRLDPKTKQPQPVTKNLENAIRYPGSDGKKIVFQAGFQLAIYDPVSRGSKPIAFSLDSDRLHARPFRTRLNPTDFNPGPTGKRVVVAARGQLLTIPVEEGDVRVVENMPGSRASLPNWSPDGKQLAFISDRSGENEVWLGDAQAVGAPRQLTSGLRANSLLLRWSPDGKWIAIQDRDGRTLLVEVATGKVTVADETGFTGSYDSANPGVQFSPDSKLVAFNRTQKAFNTSVGLYEIATKKLVALSPEGMHAYSPTFSRDGRSLAYLIERDVTSSMVSELTRKYTFDNTISVNWVALDPAAKSPFLTKDDEEVVPQEKKDEKPPAANVVLDGLADRTYAPPILAGRYRTALFSEGKLFLVNMDGMAPGSTPSLLSFDLAKAKLTTIAEGVSDVQLTADGKQLMVTKDGRPAFLSVETGPATPKLVDFTTTTISVDPEKEWKQIFEESWRMARDLFYDPGMHGVDWNAIHRKYEARLPMVGDRTDLSQLLKDMVSELNCGHAYITNPVPGKPSVGMGYLGADYDVAPMGVRVAKLLKGGDFDLGTRSPLLAQGLGIKEGSYILSVSGTPIAKDMDIQQLLVGTQGRTISLLVNDKPSLEGARTVFVKPLANEGGLRYQDWVRGRAEYVTKNAGPNFGYMHVPDMGNGGIEGFVKGQWKSKDKDAVVCDFRYNGGGYVSSMLLDNLVFKPWAYWKPRTGGYWTREDWGFRGYLAALANEQNFSDGELVIETWKHLKLGPVVGKTTGGGEVGSGGGYALIDGGLIYVPNYAGFSGSEWLVEGKGATPDVDVSQDPAAVMAGRDPQLDKAIELLKARLLKEPLPKVAHPPFPKKNG